MDKDPFEDLREDIRRTLQAINDNILELNDYLTRLRAETIIEINAAMAVEGEPSQELLDAAVKRHVLTQVPADVFVPTADEPTPDPRRPYQNQRQPRRDGDSFGSLLPFKQMEGGYYGKKTEERGD